MGLNISDIVALAKAGYKPAEVKELIALSEKEMQPKPEEQPGATAAPLKPTTESPEPVKASENEAKAAEPEKEEIDYKELYEKSQQDLKKAQEANRSADNSGKASEDPMKDLLETLSLL